MVQKLESNLNLQLLDRSGHRARFTHAGRIILEKGRRLLNEAQELEPGDAAGVGLGNGDVHGAGGLYPAAHPAPGYRCLHSGAPPYPPAPDAPCADAQRTRRRARRHRRYHHWNGPQLPENGGYTYQSLAISIPCWRWRPIIP
ncbi:hypothetical protein O0544_14070 [Edwardsiella anguillarum]|nr:hypothetical protein [Edwardsiella anguillarum]